MNAFNTKLTKFTKEKRRGKIAFSFVIFVLFVLNPASASELAASDYAAPRGMTTWLECLFYATGLASVLIHLARQARGPQPAPPNSELSLIALGLEKRIKKVEDENSAIWSKMETDARTIGLQNEQRAEKLHNRIDVILAAVSELKGGFNSIENMRDEIRELGRQIHNKK